jgi:hypothetical protein
MDRSVSSGAGALQPGERRALLGARARLPFAIGAAVVLVVLALVRPMVTGDGAEYLVTVRAWSSHASPDIRDGDLAWLRGALRPRDRHRADALERSELFSARSGRRYTLHFWMAPLVAAPAALLLRAAGGDELAAIQVTNGLLWLAALACALFGGSRGRSRRAWFTALAFVGPALWYLQWPSAEVFSWSLTVIALLLLEDERFAWAALAAGFAAQQNPPLVFLAGWAVICALRTRSVPRIAAAAVCAGVGLLPALFDQLAFGTPNLIAQLGQADARLISIRRVWSMLVDLNQGMLPWAAGLVLLAGVALGRAVVQRSWSRLGFAAVILVTAAACCSTTNWNSGCAGLQRYAVWILPLLAWLAADGLQGLQGRGWRRALWAGLTVNVVCAALGSGKESYLQPTRLATWVLIHAPALYDPEPEIFRERVRHTEDSEVARLPVAFVDPRGVATKVLVDGASLGRLSDELVVEPAYLEEVRRAHAGLGGLFYLTPPPGAARAR